MLVRVSCQLTVDTWPALLLRLHAVHTAGTPDCFQLKRRVRLPDPDFGVSKKSVNRSVTAAKVFPADVKR